MIFRFLQWLLGENRIQRCSFAGCNRWRHKGPCRVTPV